MSIATHARVTKRFLVRDRGKGVNFVGFGFGEQSVAVVAKAEMEKKGEEEEVRERKGRRNTNKTRRRTEEGELATYRKKIKLHASILQNFQNSNSVNRSGTRITASAMSILIFSTYFNFSI